MRQELSDKYSNLCAALHREKKLAVAFSAGVDSTLLLKAAVNTLGNENVLAVTALSASFPEREADEADVFTRGIGVSRITVEVDQLSIPGFQKSALYADDGSCAGEGIYSYGRGVECG